MNKWQLRCGSCGQFIDKPFDQYSHYGDSWDETPPDPILLCKKCTKEIYETYLEWGTMPYHWCNADFEEKLAKELGFELDSYHNWVRINEDTQ